MPTPGERQALGFLVFIALSGASVRLWRANRPVEVPGVAALDRQLVRVDSAQRAPKRSRKAAAPKRDTASGFAGPLDLDRATPAEIEALPGIGPSLAARIIAHRDSAGSFGSMDALCEVRGVGAALAKRLSPLVTFSAGFRPVSTACDRASKPPKKSSRQRTGK